MIRSHGVFRGDDADFEAALALLGAAAGEDRIERFEPHGASRVRLAVDRTVVLHSWPEHGLVTVDVYAAVELALDARLAPLGWRALR